jgi:hypothetical protein
MIDLSNYKERYFLDNKYTNKYFSIIERRRNSISKIQGHKHHIIPRSIDKDLIKEPSNIIYLSYKEHYICHRLLPKMCKEPIHKGKMSIALKRLLSSKNLQSVRISARLFEIIVSKDREAKVLLAKDPIFYKRMSESQSIAQSKPEPRAKRSKAMKEFYKNESEEDRLIRIQKVKKTTTTVEFKENMSQILKIVMNKPEVREKLKDINIGRVPSVEARCKMSNSQRARWENLTEEERRERIGKLKEATGTEKVRARISQTMIEKWKNDPEYVEKVLTSHKVAMSSHNVRASISLGLKKAYERPGAREKSSLRSRGGNNGRAIKVIAYDDYGWKSELFDCMKDGYKWATTTKVYLREVLQNKREYAGKHPETGNKLKWERYEN